MKRILSIITALVFALSAAGFSQETKIQTKDQDRVKLLEQEKLQDRTRVQDREQLKLKKQDKEQRHK